MKVDTSFDAKDIGRLLAIHLTEAGYDLNDADFDIPPELRIRVTGLSILQGLTPERQVKAVNFTEPPASLGAAAEASTPIPVDPSQVIAQDGIQNPEILADTQEGVRLLDVPRGPNGLARWSSKIGVRGDPVKAEPPVLPETTRVRRTIELTKEGQTRLVDPTSPMATPAKDVIPVIRSPQGPVDQAWRSAVTAAEPSPIIPASETALQHALRLRRNRG